MNADILGEAHRLQHLRTEHPTVPNLDPLVEHRMESEDFERRLGVRVISRLEANLLNTHLAEEDPHETNQIGQSKVAIRNDTFNLVEFGQVGSVHGLVSENSVDAEQLGRSETVVLCSDVIVGLAGGSTSM